MTGLEKSHFEDLMAQIESLKQQIDEAEKPKEQAFEVGDVVRLKSGGENMTVIGVGIEHAFKFLDGQAVRSNPDSLIVTYHTDTGHLTQATLPVKAVERISGRCLENAYIKCGVDCDGNYWDVTPMFDSYLHKKVEIELRGRLITEQAQ